MRGNKKHTDSVSLGNPTANCYCLVALFIFLTMFFSNTNAQTTEGIHSFIEYDPFNLMQQYSASDIRSELNEYDIYYPLEVCTSKSEFVDSVKYEGEFGITKERVKILSPSVVYIRTKSFMQTPLIGKNSSINNKGICTGSLIEGGRVLTARHCFSESTRSMISRFDTQAEDLSDAEFLATLEVVFGYTLEAKDSPSLLGYSDIDEILVDGQGDLNDFSIVKVDDSVSSRYPAIVDLGGEVTQFMNLAILQYPYGKPLQIHGGSWVKKRRNQTIGYRDINTDYTSSGSPIFNSTGGLVGIHTEPGCATGGENSGIPLSFFMSHM